MSLLNLLKKKFRVNLFTTPSHSQKFFIFSKLKQFYKYDISETDAHNPQSALLSAQKKASKIYGTKNTYFLTNGSTSGIIAAILAVVNNNEKVLIWDNAHPSHKNAVNLAGAISIFYELEKDKNWGIYTQTNPEEVEKLLKQEKIKAVIITSPTYEGVVSDVAAIKKICEKYGTYLIVDEAHGALHPFCEKLPTSAISLGADFVIQSLHKTAGGLNPTALLHCNVSHCLGLSPLNELQSHASLRAISLSGEIRCETKSTERCKECPPKQSPCDIDIQSALDLISTTSPSYPLLASIEKNINFLNSKKGRKAIIDLITNIENMKNNIQNCEFYEGTDFDPTKILIKTPALSGFELSEFLYENNIEDEKTNEKSTMLLCGIGTDFKKLKKLENVLRRLSKK